jgi:DNA-binding GntR family transcriptional regulator
VEPAEARVTIPQGLTPLDGGGDQTVDRIHSVLLGRILSGELSPGSVVSQVKLAQSLHIGRTPLREALRMLQREGLVQAEFNRRVRVSPLSTSELEQIYAHRIVLEAVAIRSSIPRFTAADLAHLRDLLAEMESFLPNPAERMAEWERPHRAFHALLVSRAGDRVGEDLRRLQDHAERYRAILSMTNPAHDSVALREALLVVQGADASGRG